MVKDRINNYKSAVLGVIGVKSLVLGLARTIAPHILIGHVAVGVIRISMLLGLGGLLAGMGVPDLQDAAYLVSGIILHPAVGIPHLRNTAHAVIGGGQLIEL